MPKATRPPAKSKPPARRAARRSARRPVPPLSARTADPLALYELAVQGPEAEIDFVTRTFRRLRERPLRVLREDFCGTAISACEFVRRHEDNRATALDLHRPTLAWGREHNVAALPAAARSRIELIPCDVLMPPARATNVDAVLAMNFSYWLFKSRDALRAYFASVRASLADDGVLFMDTYGGWESMKLQTERRRLKGFRYVWEQEAYDPITGDLTCHIHFEFHKGPPLRRAFTYRWRLWTLPEILDLLAEAGLRNVTVYWEGDDGKGGGNGVFRPRKVGEACAAFIAYITAEK